MEKILVIEDDWELNRSLCAGLSGGGYGVFPAHTLAEGRALLQEESFSLVLLDVNLPDGEGFSLCREIKIDRDIPVLFLTARDLECDVLYGLELGAEDYITKPFSLKVLLKKIEMILYRTGAREKVAFQDDHLFFDPELARISVAGVSWDLTPTEFRLLTTFLKHPGQLLTYDVLLERLWDCDSRFVDKHTLAVNVNRLRKKIEDETHKYIVNVYGMGYQWIG